MKVKWSRASLFSAGFLGILFYGLFLGDGYQTLIEPYSAGSVVVLFLLFWVTKRPLFSLPGPIQIAWSGVGAVFILSTLFSRSIGYSISELVRLIAGFLVFILFYNLSSKQLISIFLKQLIVFVVLAACVGWMLLYNPQLGQLLPPVNLLFAFYGHNHLSTLLLLVVPVSFEWAIQKKIWQRWVFVIFILVSLVATFSRGALFIVSTYCLLRLGLLHGKSRLKYKSILLVCVGLFFLCILYWSNGARLLVPDLPPHLRTQISKVSPLQNRLPYWQQSIKSFVTHPLLGSGPGTFYLESLRFQSQPASYSSYAHSYLFQLLSEVGIVGIAAVSVLFFFIVRDMVIHHQKSKIFETDVATLFWGGGLVFIYSFVDFNFNFFVVWLLFWAIVGMVYRNFVTSTKPQSTYDQLSTMLVVASLFVFFLLSFGSIVLSKDKKQREQAFFIAPYSTNSAIDLINLYKEENKSIPEVSVYLINTFHKDEPEINKNLLDSAIEKKEFIGSNSFQNLLSLDPKNISLHKKYLVWASTTGDKKHMIEAVRYSSFYFLSESVYNDLLKVEPTLLRETQLDIKSTIQQLASQSQEMYHAKLFYLLGLNIIDTNPTVAENLWRMARNSYPDAGLLHHELAALSLYELGDKIKATNYIADCMNVPHAALHCHQIEEDFSNLPPPGQVQYDILNLQ